ncbi:MAG: D-alanyl-D-alanine carboxypeptidase/D-alanyl-D-alanine endopeptidase, partial [Nocardioidaceae bacterium]
AEVLLRQSALATGRPGSATAGVEAVRATLADLGVELRGARIYDGSGLSRHDRLPIRSLVQVLQTAADPAHPKLRRVVASLPVAGFTGSLGYRFVDDAPRGVGVVRAKTGTLTGVHALAGFVATRDQHALVFVAVGDQVPVPKTLDARADLDTIATALATCGCSQ